jgi:hypothetical protein
LDDRGLLQLDHRLLDVGVDAAHDAGEQVPAHEQRLGGHRLPVVVALVQFDHRVGDGSQEVVAAEDGVGGRQRGLLSRPPDRGARRVKGVTRRAVRDLP